MDGVGVLCYDVTFGHTSPITMTCELLTYSVCSERSLYFLPLLYLMVSNAIFTRLRGMGIYDAIFYLNVESERVVKQTLNGIFVNVAYM